MTFWIIWFIGTYLSYILLRAYRRSGYDDYTWETVIAIFIASLLSWITLIIFLILIGINKLIDLVNDNEPPKWL